MSRKLGPHLPDSVRRLLEDEPEQQIGVTILVITVSEGGWSHVAMVSVGELLVLGDDRLALSLWPASTGAVNLSRSRKATLALVADARAYTLCCRVGGELELLVDPHPPTRAFALDVAEVVEDAAPYADLLSGVSYRLHDPEATLGRWLITRAALRDAFKTPPAQLDCARPSTHEGEH